jgi:D-alanine-D-alanine ligase
VIIVMTQQTYGKIEFRTQKQDICPTFVLKNLLLMLNIAIVAGGDSGEYEISVKSGRQVEMNLDKSRFIPYLIEIRKDQWIYSRDGNEFRIDKNDFTLLFDQTRIIFDVVFNAIHGTPGENGKLQGYFDLVNIPYTSCDVTTSALTFNKSFCKNVVSSYGIHTARSVHFFRDQKGIRKTILEKLVLPFFIKPNNGGSSVGMSKVNQQEEIEDALSRAFREDEEILAEEFIEGRELTCGVLRSKGEIIAFPVTEIISQKEFFDFEAKYKEGMAREVVPAEIPDHVSDECKNISRFLYERLNCKGIVRFDYTFGKGQFHFLEVNTIPGLTEQSIIPKMTRAYGWTVTELFTRMIEECLVGR